VKGATADPAEQETRASDRGGRLTRLRPAGLRRAGVRIFSSGTDAPRARRPSDLFLLIAAVLGIVIFTLIAPGPTTIGAAVENLIQLLPGLAGWFWELSYDLLVLWALILIGGALFARGRKRLLADEVLAIVIAFGVALLTGLIAGTPLSELFGALTRSGRPTVYPAMRLAVASAVMVTASPHLTRPLRYIGRWVLAAGALAAVALGIANPLGVLAGYSAGIAAASVVHLLRGSPGGRPTLRQVAQALDDLEVDAVGLRQAPLQPGGLALVTAVTPEGRHLLIKIYGRDAWEGQFFTSFWMRVWHRDDDQRLGFSRLQQVEHEAYVTLLAERGGVPVLPVVAAGADESGDALLVVRAEGEPLFGAGVLEPGDADDRTQADAPVADTATDHDLSGSGSSQASEDVIRGAWDGIRRLHDIGIAHGGLNGYRVFVRPDAAPALTGFDRATVAASDAAMRIDRARLLVTTALAAGPERAVAAAAGALGNEELGRVIPYLQPAVVDLSTRKALRDRDWDLDDLRERAATLAQIEEPKLEQIRRVSAKSIVITALIGLLAYALISALANVGLKSIVDELKNADMTLLIVALLASPFIQLGQAVSTKGASIADVGYGPVLMLQYAIQFIALAVPSSAARVALEVRFFQRNGVDPGAAVSIGLIDSVCGFVVQIILILAITLSGLASLDISSATSTSSGSSSSSSGGISIWMLLLGLLVLGVLITLIVPRYRAAVRAAIPRYLHMLRAQASSSAAALRVLRSAKHDGMIFGGNLYAQILQAIILSICLQAFGYHEALAGLILVNTFVSLFAGFMPVPGGMGVAEAGFTAGLVALGVPNAAAVSTAIAFRLVTFYLPPIWGVFAMRWLRKHAYV
jgi:uncharacterized protein (TIRG00374 family)